MTISTASSAAPMLLAATPSGTTAATSIVLDFNTAMTAGTGTIYVTDGALQTVIDRVTGLPTTRIVGGTDTHILSAADLVIDGTQVTLAVGGLLAGHTYSVVMGANALVSNDHLAFGGIRSTSQLQFTTASAPTDVPTDAPTASVSLDGATLAAGRGITATFAFSAAVTDLSAAAISAPHAVISNLHTDDGGLTWTAQLSAGEPGEWDTNAVSLDLAQVHDLAGHAGSGSATSGNYAVDTVAPHIVGLADAEHVAVAADLVITFDEPVYWSDGGGGLVLTNGAGGTTDIALGDATFSADHTTLTIAGPALQLGADTDYALTINGATDLAGNALAQNALAFHTADTMPTMPDTPAAPQLAAASDSGIIGDGATDDASPVIVGSGAQAHAEIHVNVGGAYLGTTTADADGNWTWTGLHDLDPGAYSVSVYQTDLAGNDSLVSDALMLTILANEAPPAPALAQPLLATASDSGIKGDNITNDTTPTLTGTAAAGMKRVNVYDGGVLLGHTNVDDDGTWSYTVNNGHALTDGVHQLTVRESDGTGGDANLGAPSAALALTIDTIAPTVTGTHTSLQGLKTVLSVEFSESIVFGAGAVDVSDALNLQQAQFTWDVMTNWDIANNMAGAHSVLELNLGYFVGPSHLAMEGNAIQDAAGNVAIIGNNGYINPLFPA